MNTHTSEQTETRTTLKTRLHRYHFNLTDATEREAWNTLHNKLLASGAHHFHAWGSVNGPEHTFDGTESVEDVELETGHIFGDQWNATTERVFDWSQYYEVKGRKLARGHWLEITDEMKAARIQTLACGYCGKQYGRNVEQLAFAPIHSTPPPANGFCDACLDSPYLKETELKLLRLVPLSETRNYNDDTLPKGFRELYVSRQTTGNDSRAAQRKAKQRADVLEEYQEQLDSVTKAEGNAVIEREGKLWLHDHGVDLEHVIYYKHTRRFGFFWRNKYSGGASPSVVEAMRAILEKKGDSFPYAYEFENEKVAV